MLNTSSQSTLSLAKSLAEAEFEAWSPVETIERHARRTNAREIITRALLPTMVFVKSDRLTELVTLSRSPALLYRVWDKELHRMVTKGMPTFRPFRHAGRYPLIDDRALEPLRIAERRVRAKAEQPRHTMGDRVRVTDAGFEGLAGTVLKVKGQWAWVLFKGWPVQVKVSTWLLIDDIDAKPAVHVSARKSEQAQSAKAA